MRNPRATRAVRGSVAASVATFVALLSHVAAGGAVPGPLGIAVPWILSLAVCTVLAGRTLSLVRLAPAVAISQVLFHTLFVVGTVPRGDVVTTAHHGATVVATHTPITAGAAPHAAMWVSHLIAAALTVAFIHSGERAVRALTGVGAQIATWLRRVIRRSSPAPAPAPARAVPRALRDTVIVMLSRAMVDAAPRRGPPLPATI